jgi:hypothetical protein
VPCNAGFDGEVAGARSGAEDVAAEAEADENEAMTEDANARRWGWEAGGGLHRGVGAEGRALTGGGDARRACAAVVRSDARPHAGRNWATMGLLSTRKSLGRTNHRHRRAGMAFV